jgi:hypothetical protein
MCKGCGLGRTPSFEAHYSLRLAAALGLNLLDWTSSAFLTRCLTIKTYVPVAAQKMKINGKMRRRSPCPPGLCGVEAYPRACDGRGLPTGVRRYLYEKYGRREGITCRCDLKGCLQGRCLAFSRGAELHPRGKSSLLLELLIPSTFKE